MNLSSTGLPTSIRAVILASAYWVLSLSLTVQSGSIAAILGCLLACYAADRSSKEGPLAKVTGLTIALLSVVCILVGILSAYAITHSILLNSVVAPMGSFATAEFIKWFCAAFSLTLILRCMALRTSYGAIFEILFVAFAFVVTLSAHRNGMIHRPFFIGDFALVRGIDPSSILMAIGCGAVLALSALLMMESNQRRLPYHFTVLGILCFSLLIFVKTFGLPTPQLTNDLGLTGAEASGNPRQQQNPFQDRDNNTENDQTPVAVVLFRDDYEPASGPNGSYYFRESAFSQFNGQMLDYSIRSDMDQDLIKQFTQTTIEPTQAVPDLDNRRQVKTTVGLLVPHRTPFALDSPATYEHVANPNNLRFKRTYNAYSLVPQNGFEDLLGLETGRTDWPEEVLQEYLTLPDDPRYGELARELIANLRPEYADDPYAKAQIIKMYLDENGIYSLKNAHALENDPPASFLFGDMTGYCMHFAFAATYMFRSIGIPTRVGTGYSVPASNRAGGSALLIQAIHGHAWPEVYLRGVGWTIVDPAPQQTLVDMSTEPQNNLQQLLGDMLRNESSFENYLSSQQTSFIDFRALLNTLLTLALSLLLLAYAIKLYRLWIPASASADKQRRLFYRATLDRLSAIGVTRQFGESRESFAKRVNSLSPTFQTMTSLHLSQVLGNEQKNEAQIWLDTDTSDLLESNSWQQLSQRISNDISNKIPLWKKVLAWINPVSWVLTK